MFATRTAASLTRNLTAATMAMLSLATPVAFAQASAPPQGGLPEVGGEFASENAILDTSILFAIGAREARQELRGAFGWPTFQEGLVMGVYFRFDPDGYARFAPTPRLDSDVFEVICRPRTFSCMGRKGGLAAFLNGQGRLQLKLENVAEGDQFFISDGIEELELPTRIVQPLDPQLELLLSSTNGELVIRRGDDEVERISLKGFGPVAAYLRWLTARQDYTVLPRGWPIPTTGTVATGVTQAANWQSPMPQPQNLPIQGAEAAANVPAGVEVAEVRGELRVLRELLLNSRAADQQQGNAPALAQPGLAPAAQAPALAPQQPQGIGQLPVQAAQPGFHQTPATGLPAYGVQAPAQQMGGDAARLTALEQAAGGLISEIDRLRGLPPAPTMAQPADPAPMMADAPKDATTLTSDIAIRLDYLMREIGLDAKTALMLVELGNRQRAEAPPAMDNAAERILAALKQDLAAAPTAAPQPAPAMAEPASAAAPSAQPEPVLVTQEEYRLLSQYFRSVLTPPAP